MTSASRWQPPSSSSSTSPSSSNARMNSHASMVHNSNQSVNATSMHSEHTTKSPISTTNKRQRTDDGNQNNPNQRGNDHFKSMNERGYHRTQSRGYTSNRTPPSSSNGGMVGSGGKQQDLNHSSSRGDCFFSFSFLENKIYIHVF